MRALFTQAWCPHVVLSLTFWLNSHLEHGGSSSLLIMPGLLRSDGEALVSPLLRENGRTPAAYVGDANSLSWNFIGFPCKPSYSASFLHWISLLSYPYLTTLYIFNSIVSWSPKPSPLWIPWIHRGWTPVSQYFTVTINELQPLKGFPWWSSGQAFTFKCRERGVNPWSRN